MGTKTRLNTHVVLAVYPLLDLDRVSVKLPGNRGWKDGETGTNACGKEADEKWLNRESRK
jgi:hypothetical protein